MLQDVVRVRTACAPNVDDVVNTLLVAAAQDGGSASAEPAAGLVTFSWRGAEHPGQQHASAWLQPLPGAAAWQLQRTCVLAALQPTQAFAATTHPAATTSQARCTRATCPAW